MTIGGLDTSRSLTAGRLIGFVAATLLACRALKAVLLQTWITRASRDERRALFRKTPMPAAMSSRQKSRCEPFNIFVEALPISVPLMKTRDSAIIRSRLGLVTIYHLEIEPHKGHLDSTLRPNLTVVHDDNPRRTLIPCLEWQRNHHDSLSLYSIGRKFF